MRPTWFVISDIHGNWKALEQLANRVGEADHLLLLGDYCGDCSIEEGRKTLVLIELLEKRPNTTAIFGNHDIAFPECWPSARFAEALPLATTKEISANKIHLTHFITQDWAHRVEHQEISTYFAQQFSQGIDAGFFGHTHRPFFSNHGGKLIINPGALADERYVTIIWGEEVVFWKGWNQERRESLA